MEEKAKEEVLVHVVNYTMKELQDMEVEPSEFEIANSLVGKSVYEKSHIDKLQGEVFRKYPQNTKYAYEGFREFLESNLNKLNVLVSNYGRIKINGEIKKPYRKTDDPKDDYLYVDIKVEEKKKEYKVYRLVAETWCQPPAEDTKGWTVHHLTNDGYDNRPANLLWVENKLHPNPIHNNQIHSKKK